MLEQRELNKENVELTEGFDFADNEGMIQFKIVYSFIRIVNFFSYI